MIFSLHTELLLTDFCLLQVAVIVIVFIPPFDLSLLLSLFTPSFLKEWQLQCRIMQSTSVVDSK